MKNSFKTISRFVFIFLIFIFSASLNIFNVKAIEYGGVGGKPANPDQNNPRTKSIFIITLTPGEAKDDGVLVVNNTASEKTLLVYATDSQKSNDGSFACEQFVDDKNGVGSWIKLARSEVTLKANTNEVVDFKITAPDNASVGEENGCIMIQEKKESSENSSGVSLSFRTGLRVVVTIPGEQIRELDFKNIELSQKEDGTLKVKADIQNSGNVSIDTHVHVRTSGLFGTTYNYIDNEYPILRGETSSYNFEIPKPFWGWFFTIQAEAEYDDSPTASVGKVDGQIKKIITIESKSVFSFPDITALIIELLFLATLGGIVFFIFKKYKDKKLIKETWVKYEVKKDENITSIASKYNIKWQTLAHANKLKPPYLLKEGTAILIPPSRNL